MYTFESGKGINATKLNSNFSEVQTAANANESDLNTISNTALLKDGSNLTDAMIKTLNEGVDESVTLNGSKTLQDNKSYHITLTGNSTIVLPSVSSDSFSHTIIMIVDGSNKSLNLGTTKHFINNLILDTTQTYAVLYIYNKIDNNWYYNIVQ